MGLRPSGCCDIVRKTPGRLESSGEWVCRHEQAAENLETAQLLAAIRIREFRKKLAAVLARETNAASGPRRSSEEGLRNLGPRARRDEGR